MAQMLYNITLYIIPLLFAITLHEAAHAYAAQYFGDDTAARQGRLSLNPLVHIDPIGTVLVPLAILLISNTLGSGFIFGWAKPVPVNFNHLRNPKHNMRWVALAGPAANFAMALVWALLLGLSYRSLDQGSFFLAMATLGIFLNLGLMVLNLLPILPLDGGRVVFSLLPNDYAWKYAQLERYGMMILLFLIATGATQYLFPLVRTLGLFLISIFT